MECGRINQWFFGSSSGTIEFSHANSTALCLLVNTQQHICANRIHHSLGWCEACGHVAARVDVLGTTCAAGRPLRLASGKLPSTHIASYEKGRCCQAPPCGETGLTIVYSTLYSGADQRKHQSSASLAFVRGIHRSPVNSPHKGPVTRKMFPFDDVIMNLPKIRLVSNRMNVISTNAVLT